MRLMENMFRYFELLVLLIVVVFCSSCALFGDPYSYRDDLDFMDGRYCTGAKTIGVDFKS
jgi:hypothetical protein